MRQDIMVPGDIRWAMYREIKFFPEIDVRGKLWSLRGFHKYSETASALLVLAREPVRDSISITTLVLTEDFVGWVYIPTT